ncbi:MAG: hydroxyproline-2-epimerase, partial [Proteobacteria bacterium]|nr:hydroxyproline-2-epimerase [Pseudomonadota bacterium]
TFALERGLVTPKAEGLLRLETPAGRVDVQYVREGEKVTSAKLINVPSFLMYQDVQIESPDLGSLKVDIAYGGNFYPIIERQEHFNDINDFDAPSLIQMGIRLREAIEDVCDITHPLDASISGLRHCMWTGEPMDMSSDARGCVIAGEMIDRSPCGTGTSARLAQRVAKGLLDIGAPFVHESYIGSVFTGTAEEKTMVGEYDAIIPGISGSACITGLNTIYVDSNDPFPEGFVI